MSDRPVGAARARVATTRTDPARPQERAGGGARPRSGRPAGVSSWIDAQLARLGRRRSGALEPLRTSGISRVLRVPTEAGDLYFKASPRLPTLSDEPALLETLAARFPGRVPATVAVDRRRGWMLLEDCGRPIGAAAPPEVWKRVFGALARLQVEAADHLEELAASGCRDRRLERWAGRIGPWLEEAASRSELGGEERRGLPRLVPRLEELARELGDSGVPPSLVHGDLHLANAALRRGEVVFFDWADACISHPFLDLAYVFAENAGDEAGCRDAYLAAWTRYEPRDRLARLWALGEPLSALHQAVTYLETARCLPAPSRDRFLGGVTYFLRRLLASPAAIRRPGGSVA